MKEKMDVILAYIAAANTEELDKIIEAVIHRCDAEAPETESIFLSLPKQRQGRESMQAIYDLFWKGNPPGNG